MNIDLYDLNLTSAAVTTTSSENSQSVGSSSSSTSTSNAPASSLNEEVTQVFSQLGRFWGGVRKQSQNVFESARKDLGDVVSQAQKELEKTFNPSVSSSAPAPAPAQSTEQATTTTTTTSTTSTTTTATEDVGELEGQQQIVSESAKSSPQLELASDTPTPSTTATTSFLSRLQSSLPPNITPSSLSSTFQRHLPLETLQHNFNLERASADFAQLRATLVDNIQRVQSDTTIQQAEKLAEQYLHKGEAFFKEAGEFFKDAVKVLPPEGENDASGGVMWDGTDFWSVPTTVTRTATPTTTSTPPIGSRKGKEKEDATLSALRSLGRRKEVLLRKLHSSADEIRKNPEQESDATVKEMWSSFTKDVEENGSIQGEVWKGKIEAVTVTRKDDEDIRLLLNVHKQLVPSELSDDTFWTRYFFRIAQIQQEEERRRALLENTIKQAEDQDDEFTWEDEEEEEEGGGEDGQDIVFQAANAKPSGSAEGEGATTVGSEITSSVPTLVPSPSPNPKSAPASTTHTPSISPRRSEDSYDVVSSNVSSTGQKSPETKREEAEEDNGEDSDWE